MTNESSNKAISFYKLLEEENKIEIPIIQRDYVQGKLDKTEIRKGFLEAIENSLRNENNLNLDFVYGSKVKGVFEPLDGQQRLTTLFLLHWFAYNREDIKTTEDAEILHKFTYETRVSTREFCNSLVNAEINILSEGKLSDKIKNSTWFFINWIKDPSINAMLNTLDDISEMFHDIDELWYKLTSKELITFYHIELEDIGLTDDLYIKMNSRGKLLSPFENFKASLEELINDNDWEENLDESEKFYIKIDNIWTDFFWKNFQIDGVIDDSFMNFISTILMIRISQESLQDRSTFVQKIQDDQNNKKTKYIIQAKQFTLESFNYLKMVLNVYSEFYNNYKDLLSLDFPFWRHKADENYLKQIASNKDASYTDRVLFFAQTEYLLNHSKDFNVEGYKNWMRVIRNIVSRGNIEKGGKRPDIIRSPQTFIGVINLIKELSNRNNDIYTFLNENPSLSSQFAKDQIDEEKLKSNLVVQSEENKTAIFSMEDKQLFKGRIRFALDCVEYNDESTLFDLDKFIKVDNLIDEYFDDNNDDDDISNDIRRGLLTLENSDLGFFYNYWWSYWNIGFADKRCLIQNFREVEYFIYNTGYNIFLKQLIDILIEQNLEDYINNFEIPDHFPNWKARLIKESNLLDQNPSHFIAINDDEEICYLLKSQRPRVLEGNIEVY